MNIIHHALVLNLHQPAGNLQELLDHNPWETHEILYALDRIPRSLWGYEDIARVHLSLSGTLLETLADRIAGEILEQFKVEAVFIRVRKPNVPLNGFLDNVEVEHYRRKNG